MNIMDIDTCPRCDSSVISYCACGLDFNLPLPMLTLGKYRVAFDRQHEKTVICWLLPMVYEQRLDWNASRRKLIDTYGLEGLVSENNYVKYAQNCLVYETVKVVNQDSFVIPSLRWKITEERIEGLLLLR